MNDIRNRIDQLSPEERRALLADLLRQRIQKVDAFPLSFAQEHLWFLDQLQPGAANYNIPVALRFPGPLNIPAMEWSLNEIVRRHEVLRTTFATRNSEPMQIVASSLKLRLDVEDLQNSDDVEATAQQVALEEARTGFDLGRGPLIRTRLLRLGTHDHLLLLTLHHIIADGWSFKVLLDELKTLYESACMGRPSPLQPLTIQYADFAVWQRKRLTDTRLKAEMDYWRKRLSGAPVLLAADADRPRSTVPGLAGTTQELRYSRKITERLTDISRQAHGTLFMVLLAAFKVLLYRYTGQSDLVVGTPVANRNRTELESLIGFFVNMLVLRTDLSGNPTFREAVQRVQEVTIDSYDHADIPFGRIVEELQPDRSVSNNPIFQVAFALQNVPMGPDGGANGKADGRRDAPPADPLSSGIGGAKFDLVLAMGETSDGLAGTFEYNTDLFDPATVQQMSNHFTTILEAVTKDPDVPVLNIPLSINGHNGSRPDTRMNHKDHAEDFQF